MEVGWYMRQLIPIEGTRYYCSCNTWKSVVTSSTKEVKDTAFHSYTHSGMHSARYNCRSWEGIRKDFIHIPVFFFVRKLVFPERVWQKVRQKCSSWEQYLNATGRAQTCPNQNCCAQGKYWHLYFNTENSSPGFSEASVLRSEKNRIRSIIIQSWYSC